MKKNVPSNRCAFLILAGALLLATGCGRGPGGPSSASAPELTLYVPCGMELPFMAAKRAFEAARPGTGVNLVLDNPNILVRLIVNRGGRPDLVVSPGAVEMEKLIQSGHVRADEIRYLSRYELALFVPRSNPGNVTTTADLVNSAVKVVAIADPDENSVGRYSRQALQKLGLWEELQPKLVFTDHPITAYKYVAQGKAHASFAYRSCPLKTAPDKLEYSKIRIIESMPADSYGPAFANIAPLADTPRRELAEDFIAFLQSEPGRNLLAEYDMPVVTSLRCFVPCGMTGPFFNLKRLFEAENPDVVVELVFDRADALTDRILEQGDRPDIHFSIGHVETEQLIAAGLVEPGAPVPFGTFRLALCAHVSRLDNIRSVADLADPRVNSILLTPPENSSVGFYAKAALEKLGLWDRVASKVTYLPTIRDCYRELSAGRADASFAYVGCPLPVDPDKLEYSKVQTVEVLAEDLYGGAVTYASVLRGGANAEEAVRLIAFLARPEVQEMLSRVGLCPPNIAPDSEDAGGR